ncbi:uncharacterized protein LOC143433277 [Xylocopa sonorina]|uniref:uncharacterized protein LOC143433277 n=1 Tax=Xylocopa sonorina TaxID=1818115 RepID=UPI00403A7D8E
MKIFFAVFKLFLIFNLIPDAMLQLVPSARQCVMQGMFEINDGTCQNYYICIFDGVRFVSYDMKCATSMVFDPIAQYCKSTAEYVCTQTPPATPPDTPPCTMSGRFVISGTGCRRYYLCYFDDTTFVKVDNLHCPNSLLFNQATQTCALPTSFICNV